MVRRNPNERQTKIAPSSTFYLFKIYFQSCFKTTKSEDLYQDRNYPAVSYESQLKYESLSANADETAFVY